MGSVSPSRASCKIAIVGAGLAGSCYCKLQNVLFREALKSGAVVNFGIRIQKIGFENSTLEPTDGTTTGAFDVILGADGEKSFCRESLLGRDDPLLDRGFDIYPATVKIDGVAKQPEIAGWVNVHSINMWIGPEGHTVTYPIKKGNLLNIVLTHEHESDSSTSAGPVPVGSEVVHEAFEHWSPEFHQLLSLPTAWMKRRMMYSPECTSWLHLSGHFALLGDSAHGSPPYLAQGAAIAFEDAAVLGVLFSKIQSKNDMPGLLTMYDNLRRPRALLCKGRSRALCNIFDEEWPRARRERQIVVAKVIL
ncbi:89c65692-5262-4684-84ac-732b6e17c373 [Sclerotinia trifoliorum]|uniref:89c65692-5262-4684-84ac-732b6e17c373 n=1 Tax=Sclerotinia trifoliorum TaxID=28548 RepID=A0A8H2VPD5_9HELO|nr:89c65692-5262-4684-84ac-732b6e17c373 [Sclerotinia trifoliorum]